MVYKQQVQTSLLYSLMDSISEIHHCGRLCISAECCRMGQFFVPSIPASIASWRASVSNRRFFKFVGCVQKASLLSFFAMGVKRLLSTEGGLGEGVLIFFEGVRPWVKRKPISAKALTKDGGVLSKWALGIYSNKPAQIAAKGIPKLIWYLSGHRHESLWDFWHNFQTSVWQGISYREGCGLIML